MFLRSFCLWLIWPKFITGSTVKLPDWGNPLFGVLISYSRGGISFRLKTVIHVDFLSWFSVLSPHYFFWYQWMVSTKKKWANLFQIAYKSNPLEPHCITHHLDIYDIKDFHCQGQLFKCIFMQNHTLHFFILHFIIFSKPKCLVPGICPSKTG